MKLMKLYMPYLLASQHQLVHASCLITCMWFNWEAYGSIIKIVNNTYHSTEVFEAFKYINMTHFLCLFIELSFRVIEYRESLNKTRFSFSYLTKILQLIKMVSYRTFQSSNTSNSSLSIFTCKTKVNQLRMRTKTQSGYSTRQSYFTPIFSRRCFLFQFQDRSPS